jgi:uncharacterized membrane-anchored protein
MNSMTKLAVVLAVLFSIAGSFILYESWPHITGETVVLRTQPVDPFDPLRGQYIVIAYDISTVPAPEGAKERDTIYVPLVQSGDVWESTGASLTRPQGLFIAGEITFIDRDIARVRYGIEQYYFEHRSIVNTTNMTVEVKISSGGRAKITRLINNGQNALTYR